MKLSRYLSGLAVSVGKISGQKCAWILLDPDLLGLQKLWIAQDRNLVAFPRSERLIAAVRRVPQGAQAATTRADWVRELIAGMGHFEAVEGCAHVLPVMEKHRVQAVVGWMKAAPGRSLGIPPVHLSAVRTHLRQAFSQQKTITEAGALRWILARSDRPCAVAHPDGTLLGASLSAREILQEMRFGPRHFLRADDPVLPSILTRSIAKAETGQVLMTPNCTARFEALPVVSGAWTPAVGIEFHLEEQIESPLPLSKLTAVERDILGLIATGKTNRQIAAARGTAYATVKNQVSGMLWKTGVSRRIHLVTRQAAFPSVPVALASSTMGRPEFTSEGKKISIISRCT